MASKNTDIIEQLADTIVANLTTPIARRGKETAPNDKTYPSIIIGVNRKFTDNVSDDEQSEIIEKFSIPEAVEEGENNYYTFKINGAYYCKQQNGDFKLYDKIMVYIPNGNWDNLYIDQQSRATKTGGGDGEHITLPVVIVSVNPPDGYIHNSILWMVVINKVDFSELTKDDFIKIYGYLPNENNIKQWVKLNTTIDKNIPTDVGDYHCWIELNDDNQFSGLYIYKSNVGWGKVNPNSNDLIIVTKHPPNIGDYWIQINDDEDKKFIGLFRFEYVEEESCMKWNQLCKAGGDIYINIDHAILIGQEEVT